MDKRIFFYNYLNIWLAHLSDLYLLNELLDDSRTSWVKLVKLIQVPQTNGKFKLKITFLGLIFTLTVKVPASYPPGKKSLDKLIVKPIGFLTSKNVSKRERIM